MKQANHLPGVHLRRQMNTEEDKPTRRSRGRLSQTEEAAFFYSPQSPTPQG